MCSAYLLRLVSFLLFILSSGADSEYEDNQKVVTVISLPYMCTCDF